MTTDGLTESYGTKPELYAGNLKDVVVGIVDPETTISAPKILSCLMICNLLKLGDTESLKY